MLSNNQQVQCKFCAWEGHPCGLKQHECEAHSAPLCVWCHGLFAHHNTWKPHALQCSQEETCTFNRCTYTAPRGMHRAHVSEFHGFPDCVCGVRIEHVGNFKQHLNVCLRPVVCEMPGCEFEGTQTEQDRHVISMHAYPLCGLCGRQADNFANFVAHGAACRRVLPCDVRECEFAGNTLEMETHLMNTHGYPGCRSCDKTYQSRGAWIMHVNGCCSYLRVVQNMQQLAQRDFARLVVMCALDAVSAGWDVDSVYRARDGVEGDYRYVAQCAPGKGFCFNLNGYHDDPEDVICPVFLDVTVRGFIQICTHPQCAPFMSQLHRLPWSGGKHGVKISVTLDHVAAFTCFDDDPDGWALFNRNIASHVRRSLLDEECLRVKAVDILFPAFTERRKNLARALPPPVVYENYDRGQNRRAGPKNSELVAEAGRRRVARDKLDEVPEPTDPRRYAREVKKMPRPTHVLSRVNSPDLVALELQLANFPVNDCMKGSSFVELVRIDRQKQGILRELGELRAVHRARTLSLRESARASFSHILKAIGVLSTELGSAVRSTAPDEKN